MVDEKKPAECPIDTIWLRRMHDVLPPRIWVESKLRNLEKCLEAAKARTASE